MTPAELTARGVRVKYIYAPDCDECGDTGWVYFSCGTPWRCKCQRKSRAASPQERTMTDAMPRQDLKLPPPIGYISREEHAALIREAEAERDEAQRLMQMRHREMLAADKLMRKHQGRAVAAEADRDRLAAANAVLEAKVAGLREAVDEQTKARAQHWLRRTMTAPEDAEVEALCERCGYGAVMDAASRLWARKPHGSGAFYIGGCIGFKSDEEARAALAEVQADARREGGE